MFHKNIQNSRKSILRALISLSPVSGASKKLTFIKVTLKILALNLPLGIMFDLFKQTCNNILLSSNINDNLHCDGM